MGKKLKIFGLSVGGATFTLTLIFVFGLFGLGYYKFFAPKYENVRRDVFENTKSYLQGAQQDLGKYYLEYQTADEPGKATIKVTIQMRFAELDGDKLQSIQLQSFLRTMRGY